MKSALKKAGMLMLSIICFFVAKEVVKAPMENYQPTSVDSSSYEKTFSKEVSESGIDAAAGNEILGVTKALVRDKKKIATLAEAYGDIDSGTIKGIRIYLNSNPERKATVGYVLVKTIEESMNLPIQLDEYTSITGLHYSELAESVVYHYTLEEEILDQFDGDYEALKAALEDVNPDAVCKLSLQLLGQGFDMTYSYRNFSGKELFSIVRSYKDCERLGFDEHS